MKVGLVERIATVFIGLGLALLINCGSTDDPEPGGRFSDDGGSSSGSSSGFGDGGVTPPAKGVILVHAAGFRALRVCFENYPTLAPQPDRRVMPESNSVGLDVGGAVRLGAIGQAPGTVYVIPQDEIQHRPDDPEDAPCGTFLRNRKPKEDYLIAGEISRPVGTDGVEAIVITGCGTAPQIDNLDLHPEDCPGYEDNGAANGTLRALVVPLQTTTTTTTTTMPVEIFNASHLLLAHQPPGAALDVTYGDLDAGAGAPLAQPVLTDPTLFKPNPSVVLDVDQSKIETFGTHGFRVAYRLDGGANDPSAFWIDQTLAQVQAISQPLSTPTSYFTGETNFALVLLGDPRVKSTYPDGGANPSFDERRAVHLLAIPVRAEEDTPALGERPTDAGADASDASD